MCHAAADEELTQEHCQCFVKVKSDNFNKIAKEINKMTHYQHRKHSSNNKTQQKVKEDWFKAAATFLTKICSKINPQIHIDD